MEKTVGKGNTEPHKFNHFSPQRYNEENTEFHRRKCYQEQNEAHHSQDIYLYLSRFSYGPKISIESQETAEFLRTKNVYLSEGAKRATDSHSHVTLASQIGQEFFIILMHQVSHLADFQGIKGIEKVGN